MRILDVQPIHRNDLLDGLRRTPLVGFGQTEVYASASLSVDPRLDPEELVPAQRYVLRATVAAVMALRDALGDHGVDIFHMDGGVWVHSDDNPDDPIPVIPPIIEESDEPDGRRILLINDGQHRVYAARRLGMSISCVVARNVSPDFPYYALGLEGWTDVVELDELPDRFVKKTYRNPSNYKALFRNFNAVFPGVQAQRKRTNPPHLTP